MYSSAAAAEELHHLEAVRRRARQATGAVWFPLLLGGIATVASPGAFVVIGRPDAAAWYWAIAGPVIAVSCAFFYARRPMQLPNRSVVVSLVVAAAMVLGAVAIGVALGAGAGDGAPELVVAAGLACFAWLYRSPIVAVVSATALATAAVMSVADEIRFEYAATLAFGFVACGCAMAVLLHDQATPGKDSPKGQ